MSVSRATTAVVLAGLFSALSAVSTEASLLRCKSDPIVLLSDGTEVDLTADIDTALGSVTNVDYTLHVPTGLNVLLVLKTPNWPTTIERFKIVADNPKGRYSASTVARTTKTGVAVTVQLLVRLAFASVKGQTGQTLSLQVTIPQLLPDLIP